ncbi:MAG: IreB family regulatory phosphoprotein [Clostridia bacterium]|nr:IreB family regulatory phosphoprotein [Clostridia bacterium]MBQ9880177.1 IreB family regulatory phosphoprotein [Clostridia bacterium]
MGDTINIKDTHPFSGSTTTFSTTYEKLTHVYGALKEKGYNPINQILGYIITQDPTYITTHKDARKIMLSVDREDLVRELLRSYLNKD